MPEREVQSRETPDVGQVVAREDFDYEAFWSDPENHARGRAAIDQAVEDAVECFESRRGIVAFAGHRLPLEQAHAEVRMIARWGASLALGLQRNPNRDSRIETPMPRAEFGR